MRPMYDPNTPNPLQKLPTGIEGFDEISGGGLPRGRTTLLVGGPGSGKTVFALNTLVNGARKYGEPGIFVAFEENSGQIFVNSASFGWDLPELIERNLFFIDARLSSNMLQVGDFDLAGLLAGIQAKSDEMSATAGGKPVRIVFDAVDVLLEHLRDLRLRREEIYRLHYWLGQNRHTGIITAQAGRSEMNGSGEEDFMQYMADCVIWLRRVIQDGVSHRTLTIIKYRGSAFAENEFNVVITPDGLEVPSLSIFDLSYPVATDRVSSGIERVDAMLEGGYLRGSSVLITGLPGTAKSTLAGSFVQAAAHRGEKSLYISFDEGPAEIVRNLASVNIQLEPLVNQGLLVLYASRAEARSATEHLVQIKYLLREFKPDCLVIDPLSSMVKAGGEQLAKSMAQRLIYETKAAGITLLMTSLLADIRPEAEVTPIEISSIADTWIHLSYMIQSGERNRALTIIKSRGTHHSNQVRELILSDEGVTLSDVYMAGGAVMMGTMRFEHEAAERENRIRLSIEAERKRRELEARRAEANLQLEAIKAEIASAEAELAILDQEDTQLAARTEEDRVERVRRREGDTQGQVDRTK